MLASAHGTAPFRVDLSWIQSLPAGYALIWSAAISIILGAVFLLYGYRACRWLIPIQCTVAGAMVGYTLAMKYEFNLLLGTVAGAIVLGVIGWTLYKIVCSAMGGLLVVALLTMAWPDVAVHAGPYVWAVWGAAFAVGFVMVLVLFRPLLIIVTSIYGAVFVVVGVLVLAHLWPTLSETVEILMNARPWVLAVLVVAPVVLGAVLQFLDPAAKEGAAKPAKKKPAVKKSAAKKEEAEE